MGKGRARSGEAGGELSMRSSACQNPNFPATPNTGVTEGSVARRATGKKETEVLGNHRLPGTISRAFPHYYNTCVRARKMAPREAVSLESMLRGLEVFFTVHRKELQGVMTSQG